MAPIDMMFDSVNRRAVITGLGVIAANGKDLHTFWSSIRDGVSGAGPVTRFDVTQAPTRIAAEVRDFDGGRYMDQKTARRLERSHLYSVAAARLAADHARIDFSKIDPDRAGVVEGTTVSSNEAAHKTEEAYVKKGYRGVNPFALINGYSGAGCGEIAHELGIKGHAISCSSGSASGNDAIGYALAMIQNDEVDVMLAGGSEAPIMRHVWGGLCLSKVMTRRNDDPQRAMRPFDQTRDGIILGEGAGYVVMEELSFALTRGATIYAEVLGHGRSCEAYHPVALHPEGVGIHRAMQKALRRARMDVSDVDYINAHGTATESNDLVETKAIKRLFGDHAKRLAISSTKPVTGHLMGAAGALETVVCALALHHQEVPLTLNFNDPAEGCDLDYVRGESRRYPLRTVLNLSSGFGGKNSCVVLGQYNGNS